MSNNRSYVTLDSMPENNNNKKHVFNSLCTKFVVFLLLQQPQMVPETGLVEQK